MYDFLEYLNLKGAFPVAPNAFRVAALLENMVSNGLLIPVGRARPSIAGLGNHYVYTPTLRDVRPGLFGLVGILGPEYLFELCAAGMMHITGTNGTGDAVAGTGLVVDECHVLTCRHVLADMRVAPVQAVQGRACAVHSDDLHTASRCRSWQAREHGEEEQIYGLFAVLHSS